MQVRRVKGGFDLAHMESAVTTCPQWNSCYLLARFVKSFYVKDCICEYQRRNQMGSIKLITLQPLKEYDIYLCLILVAQFYWFMDQQYTVQCTVHSQENFSITDQICIQIKLFPNFHNKISHSFTIFVRLQSWQPLLSQPTFLTFLTYLTYLTYLPNLFKTPGPAVFQWLLLQTM